MKIFFLLLCVHALTDFQLQNGAMWQRKRRSKRCGSGPCWWYWLTAHALICGGGVYVVTQCLPLAICEVFLHWMIDFYRGEEWINSNVDQSFHLACRIGYAIIFMGAASE